MTNEKQYDQLLRLLLIGDSGVGKTQILTRYSDNTIITAYVATIGNMSEKRCSCVCMCVCVCVCVCLCVCMLHISYTPSQKNSVKNSAVRP